MANETCPQCGAPLSGDEPEGLCPRCLLDAAKEPAIPALEQLFPEYEIQTLLGRGGMGEVYRAVDRKLDRPVALKILRQGSTPERFFREARVLARLKHPGIVYLHDFGEREGVLFLVMEYVEGGSLREQMRARIKLSETRRILAEVGEALEYAHKQGVVHRDVKPENILLDQDGRVRLVDFGLVKLLEKPDAYRSTQQSMGTPYYMAPEQLGDPKAVDARADMYAFGVVAYEMLTGELPVGETDQPGVPAPYNGLVRRCLQRDPDARWPNMTSLLAAIARPDAAAAVTATRAAKTDSVAKPLLICAILAFLLCFSWWARFTTVSYRYEKPAEKIKVYTHHLRKGTELDLELWLFEFPGWTIAVMAGIVAILMAGRLHGKEWLGFRYELGLIIGTLIVLLIVMIGSYVSQHFVGSSPAEFSMLPGMIFEIAAWVVMLALLIMGNREPKPAGVSSRLRRKRRIDGRLARKRREKERRRKGDAPVSGATP